MNSKHIMTTIACAAAFCGSVRAATNETSEAAAPVGWNWALGEGVTFNETPIVSGEASLAFDSKFLSYGLVDNNDPILTPAASLTFFDWLSVGVSAIFDTTKYGQGAGYYNRAWRYQELDPEVSLGHSLSPDDAAWLPTTVDWSIGYMFEYHPRSLNGETEAGEVEEDPNTQFLMAEIALPDLWFEPTFGYEKDIMRDHGTYLNFEVGHTFALIDGATEEDDPILTFRPSVAQGWGDRRRVAGYLCDRDEEPLERNALMDTALKGELAWQICTGVTLSGYVQYSDYLFDRHAREASRRYEATGSWKHSWNFTAGLALAVAF